MATSNAPLSTARPQLLAALEQSGECDLLIIGGGATGLGVALDAALRGLSVILLESRDFASGTSSRATKLLHGGVRYLAQGNIALVYEALHERSAVLHNAPHLASPLPFVMPGYQFWEKPFYGVGLKIYDAMAGKSGLGPTQFLNAAQTLAYLPNIQTRDLKGGVKYWDAQFDDARLAMALARTAAQQGALLINYCPVTDLLYENGRLTGARCADAETGKIYTVRAKCTVNAAGAWVDGLRKKDGAAMDREISPLVEPSQGVHLIVDQRFLPGGHALLVPRTEDGRVLFAVPWLGKVILGTTDTPRHDLPQEPDAFPAEVDFILAEVGKHLTLAPTRADVSSIWVGLRPLVKSGHHEAAGNTKSISREHTVLISPSGLVTVAGGKWTTYRTMAEDVLAKCGAAGLLTNLPPARTKDFRLVGAQQASARRAFLMQAPGLGAYGDEGAWIQEMEGHDCVLTEGLTQAMLRFAARHEYARTVEDVLGRRSRLLFLDAKLAACIAPQVAAVMQQETGLDPQLDEFLRLAEHYGRMPA